MEELDLFRSLGHQRAFEIRQKVIYGPKSRLSIPVLRSAMNTEYTKGITCWLEKSRKKGKERWRYEVFRETECLVKT